MLQETQPFFSNDMEGWLKVGGFLGIILGFIWKVMFSSFSDRLKEVEREQKVTIERRSSVDTDLNKLKTDALLMAADLRGLDESFGESNTRLSHFMDKIEQKETETARAIMKLSNEVSGLSALLKKGQNGK